MKHYCKFDISRIVLVFLTICLPLVLLAQVQEATIVDARHYSQVLAEARDYRIFLPPGYSKDATKRYPVIYFFHGWSQRYFGSSNPYGDFDKGEENGGDNIAAFVSKHDVIVVKADGYNRSPNEDYYVRPYNVSPVETYRQFPIYFPELIDHIDTHYRTMPDREHRGIAGLSMGGFMTFWIAGKYPHLVSAAGNFCGSPEFIVGPKDFPVEYRHLDMYKNYGGMNVRLHYGDKDFIRGYHEDLNKVWPQVIDNYSFKIFDAAHSTAGMGEMFSFILKTFDNAPPKPERWHHTDVYPTFTVWDYNVMTDRSQAGFTVLEKVDRHGFRSAVREHLPDGKLMPSVNVTVRTAPVYEKNERYVITRFNTTTSEKSREELQSDHQGRLTIGLSGGAHEIGINRSEQQPNITVTAYELQGRNWATGGEDIQVNITVLNKGTAEGRNLTMRMTPTRPGTDVINGEAIVSVIPANATGNVTMSFRVNDPGLEIIRLRLATRDGRKNEWIDHMQIPIKRKSSDFADFEIADGRVLTVAKSGVDTETVKLGAGNGDGFANPGESIVILVRDGKKLWRTDVTSNDKYLDPFGIKIRKSDNWSPLDHVGASAKYDVPLISSDCPTDHTLELFVQYWLPEYPLHHTREGIVRVKVSGHDTTPPIIRSIRANGNNLIEVEVLDGSPLRKVIATIIDEKDPNKSFSTVLTDDGNQGDAVGGDLVFSRVIPSQVFGIFRVVVEAEDTFGNKTLFEGEEKFVLH